MKLQLRLAALLWTTAGCGLISADVTRVSFDLPPKSYSFDTNDSGWIAPTGNIPIVPCGAGEVVVDCCNPPAPLPTPDCKLTPLSCDAGRCTLKFPISVFQSVNLKSEVPQLKPYDRQYLLNVFISQIRYSVTNTLNVDLPAVELFIAPDGITSPSDPQAERFGTVPVAKAMVSGEDLVELEPGSDLVFARYAHEFGTPFNFIAATTIVVPSGSPIPKGRVDITIMGQVSASL